MNRGKETCELPDLTNTLPESLIEDILQSLPIRDLVRTSVLSTEWRDRWKTIPCLVFDEFCTNFVGIISYILAQHVGPIQSFHLHFVYPETANVSEWIILQQYVNVVKCIDEWIYILKEKSIKNLSIEMDLGLPTFIKESVFACDTLEVLMLKLCTLHPPRSYNDFEHLKDLHLEEVNVTAKEFREFASKCPALENLTLIKVDMESVWLSKNRKLKYLDIQGSFHELCQNVQGVKFFLLHLSYMIEDVDSLRQKGTCNLSTVFANLTGIEKLELWSDSMKYLEIGGVPMKLPFMLNSLKEMFLAIDFKDLDDIAVALSLIRSSPNLEKLQIGETLMTPNHGGIASDEFWKEQYQIDTNFKCLKIMVMGDIAPWVSNQLQFMRYIRERSPVLQRMDFSWMSEVITYHIP